MSTTSTDCRMRRRAAIKLGVFVSISAGSGGREPAVTTEQCAVCVCLVDTKGDRR